jgi:hypothetical protein
MDAFSFTRHPDANRGPCGKGRASGKAWVPAFAGMTKEGRE